MLYAALALPFPPAAVERTDGRVTGRGYDTTGIKCQYVVNRLNEVLGVGGFRAVCATSVRVAQTAKGRPLYEALAELTLELGEWQGGHWRCYAIAAAPGGHVAVGEVDARKGAWTNAFKKAASFFGVGRQAYEGSLDDDSAPQPVAKPGAATITSTPPAPEEGGVAGGVPPLPDARVQQWIHAVEEARNQERLIDLIEKRSSLLAHATSAQDARMDAAEGRAAIRLGLPAAESVAERLCTDV